jgi:hypothetical protein
MDILKKIQALLFEAHEIRKTFRERMSKLNSERSLWSEEEYSKRQRKIEGENRALLNDGYLRMTQALEVLSAEIETLDTASPDLKNTELVNAMRIIETAGGALEYRQLFDINSAFQGKIPELKILEATYRKLGMTNNGGIEKLLLSSAPNLDKLLEYAYSLYYQEGSVNAMAQQISRIADILNEEFETNIDGGALEGAIRSGAGLPEKK